MATWRTRPARGAGMGQLYADQRRPSFEPYNAGLAARCGRMNAPPRRGGAMQSIFRASTGIPDLLLGRNQQGFRRDVTRTERGSVGNRAEDHGWRAEIGRRSGRGRNREIEASVNALSQTPHVGERGQSGFHEPGCVRPWLRRSRRKSRIPKIRLSPVAQRRRSSKPPGPTRFSKTSAACAPRLRPSNWKARERSPA